MTDKIDTSTEAVERLAMNLPGSQPYSPNSHNAAEMLRALVAERDALKAEVDELKACAKARHECLAQDQEVIADLKLEADRLRVDLHKGASISPKCVADPQAELDATAKIIAEKDRQNKELRAEVERLTDVLEQKPTDAQKCSAALSYDHSFGLMSKENQKMLIWQAGEWLTAWQKEIRAALKGDT